MASSTGNSLQPFVPGTNPSEAWGKWKKRFQMFYIATEIDKKSIPRQRAILLYNIGELALDIYSTFKIQETDASPTVPDILELFDGHFKPYKNTTYKRYQFFTTEQGENQNFDDYVTELKNKSMDCEFGELADSLVRDRIIIGIKDKALKERMLQDPDLSLAKAIDLGRATETSRQQVKNITREDVDLHSIKYKKQYKKNFKYPVGRKPNVSEEHPNAKVCQNCGSRHPYGKCFAYGKICNSCKKPNHFAKMCRNRVHMLEERAEEEEEMCLQYLSLDSITGLEWTKIILVENNSVNFKLDTGAQVNILPLDTIKNWQNKPCIYPTGIAVYSYTGEKVPIRGKCKASCTSGKKSEILEFLVVDLPAPPILGLAACKKLELILKVESLEQDHTRTKMDASPTKIIESYRDVFDEIGTLPGEHSVILRENAHPRIQLARRIPFALKKPVEMELKSMEEQKIISKVDQPAEWAHPMVIIKKPNGKVRICMDPRELNPWIKMEYRQLPAPEGIIADITKSPIYTVLDAKSAFWQIKLDEKSSSLLTMATPYGYYRFHRLPFGICSAPEVFYKKMQSMFTGIEGVKVYMDDIIIYGNSLTEHNSRLITVLEIARKNNLKFEFNKMQLAQEKVKFIGHEISKNGISADPSKLEAIQKIKRPMDKTSLQRFLGTVNYLAKFMHNLADKTVLLRQLLKKNTLWTWNEAIEKEFIELKNLVSNPPVLGLFDPHRKVTLSVDASQHGLGAVLMQEGRPIAFASASLNNTQKKYAQIEKELLALWYGCQRFNYHLYGRKFTAQTDHKPLLAILKKPLEELSPRLERLVLKLMRYDFNLEYVPGKVIHTADTLSRDSISEETIDTSDLDLQNTIMTLNLKVTTKRYQEILRDMESDEEMIKLRDHILNGWPIHKKSVDYAVKPYWHCKEELYIWKDLICRGQRLVIPKVQRESILQTLHMSHQGISACKNRAHEAIYWPGLDREIEEMVYKCRICQESQPSQRKEPLIPHEIADYPWQKVAIDFFYLDQSVFIIIVDYYSSFPEVIKVASTSAKEILPVLKSTFARHGIPEIIITDNGPPFTSQDFTNFTNEWDIEHKTSSPGYPKSNGLVERMVQTVKKQLKKCRQDNTDPYMCLIALRTTPSNNLPSPAQMLMGRNLRTLIPMKTTKLKPAFISTENILQQKRENQYKMKEYYDRNAKILPKMSSGEQVNAKTSNAWRPATIIGEANQPRSYIIQNNEGRMLKRNRVHLRPRSYPVGQRRSSQSSPQLDPAPSTSSESSGQREPGEFPRLNLSPEELAPSTSTPIGNYNEGGTAYTTRSGRVHLLEAREFTILTDHRPLIYAFKQKNEKASPRQLRHLQYISQFSNDIKYIKGTDNIVADALSRVDAITTIDYEEIAKEQTGDSELQNLISKNTSLKFKQCPLQSGNLLWNFHELSHPGIKATTKQLTSRFIWPNMNKDIRKWAQACVNCQKCKVSIHTKSEIGKYQEVDERFSVVHIDLIGTLPPSNGNIYCLTCIDRYTSWMEVVPLPDMKSETVARAFYENWIVRFGAPHTVISDQGKQFTSQLFKDLTTLCGIKLRHSTAYHPQCNGKIERLHRTIKTAIRAHNNIKWTETLPTVLLGLRAMVYGKTIRLPGEFFDDSKHHLHAEEFVQQLQKQMELLKPLNEKHHSKTKVFVHKDLKTCSHVFIRTDRVRKPLEPPYEGPFPVLDRTDKYFTLKVKERNVTISIDRLRHAYLLADSDNVTSEHPTATRPIVSGALPSTSSQQNPDPPDVEKYTEFQGTGSAPDLTRTRSGRIIKKPVRFKEQ
ncbi:K02A2.6-like [Cordylochernes scorpioides]|uniref:RNA-directed DNA polymerase n=1 Tax=Cordylochernes scorpioides TaxID=51811 RepID=A0ABY6K1C3_9ARAC|nr:K02A2.6-like [Cordylochernes scorpioides]